MRCRWKKKLTIRSTKCTNSCVWYLECFVKSQGYRLNLPEIYFVPIYASLVNEEPQLTIDIPYLHNMEWPEIMYCTCARKSEYNFHVRILGC